MILRWFARLCKPAAILVVISVVFAMLFGPRYLCVGCGSRHHITHIMMKQYLQEAYPEWSAAHPDRVCPASLRDLDPYMNVDHDRDSWGTPFEFQCNETARHDNRRLLIISAGEDRVFGTDDDLVGWE